MDLIGKQLPSVSAADNGKVLGVENGAWKPVAGVSKTPVIVKFTITDKNSGTWSGASWNELVEAYYDGRAYLAYGTLVERITGNSIDQSTHELHRLFVLVAGGENLLIRAELSELNIVYFATYQLSPKPID